MPGKQKWAIDPGHSEIGFKVKHMMISNIRGIFRTYESSVLTTGIDFNTADIEVWIDVASIDTRNEQRDEHLKGREFFDIKNHRYIHFKSTSIQPGASVRTYELLGELTIRDITKKIKLEVETGGTIKDPFGKEKAGFSISGKIQRKDWGLTWNKALETGGALLDEEIHIQCEIQLVNITDEKKTNEKETRKAEEQEQD